MSQEMVDILRNAAEERKIVLTEQEIQEGAQELEKVNPGEGVIIGGHEVVRGCGWVNIYPKDSED